MCRKKIPRGIALLHFSQIGQPVGGKHLVIARQAVQGVRDKYSKLFGKHAVTMVTFM